MRKVTKKDVDQMRLRGKSVTTVKEASKKDKPVSDVPMASMSVVIEKIADDNRKTIKSFAEEVRKAVGRKRKPWNFTVNRNKQGTITTVRADPIEVND